MAHLTRAASRESEILKFTVYMITVLSNYAQSMTAQTPIRRRASSTVVSRWTEQFFN